MRVSNSLYNKYVTETGQVLDFPIHWYSMLLNEIKTWRKETAQLIGLPAYCVFSDHTLYNLVRVLPKTINDLWLVKGFSSILIDTYGKELCQIFNSFFSSKGVDAILYGKMALDITSERIKGIVGYLGLLDYFDVSKEEIANP